MSRFASAANESAVAAPHVDYVMFAELDFLSGSIYCSTGDREYTWGGHTWGALGKLAGISDVNESTELAGQQLTLTLSGVDNSLITTVLGENYHGRSLSLYVGFLDVNRALIDTPETLWDGLMDTMTISSSQNGSAIALACQTRLMRWAQQVGWLYSQDHQRIFDGTDNFFDQVTALANKSLKWGDTQIRQGAGSASRGYIGGGHHDPVPLF